jgi:hypothetical protein
MAKSTPIHQPRACGAHQADSPAAAADRLRWLRDVHRWIDPSGRRSRSAVTNGHGPDLDSLAHPEGNLIQPGRTRTGAA